VPIAPGELLDKLSILEIKLVRISDPDKLANVKIEHRFLSETRVAEVPESPELADLYDELAMVNQALWNIEDDIRECERDAEFGARFIELARSVYVQNDRRAATKRKINVLLGSSIVEEKSYQDY
jgi:hypothetical protein